MVTMTDMLAAGGRSLAVFKDRNSHTAGSFIPATPAELLSVLSEGDTLGSKKATRAASINTNRNFKLATVG